MTSRILRVGPAPGQRQLLTVAPCDCDTQEMQVVTRKVAEVGMLTVDRHQCAIGPAVAIALAAASLVNPSNAAEGYREAANRAAHKVADALEEIARGIRARAGQ